MVWDSKDVTWGTEFDKPASDLGPYSRRRLDEGYDRQRADIGGAFIGGQKNLKGAEGQLWSGVAQQQQRMGGLANRRGFTPGGMRAAQGAGGELESRGYGMAQHIRAMEQQSRDRLLQQMMARRAAGEMGMQGAESDYMGMIGQEGVAAAQANAAQQAADAAAQKQWFETGLSAASMGLAAVGTAGKHTDPPPKKGDQVSDKRAKEQAFAAGQRDQDAMIRQSHARRNEVMTPTTTTGVMEPAPQPQPSWQGVTYDPANPSGAPRAQANASFDMSRYTNMPPGMARTKAQEAALRGDYAAAEQWAQAGRNVAKTRANTGEHIYPASIEIGNNMTMADPSWYNYGEKYIPDFVKGGGAFVMSDQRAKDRAYRAGRASVDATMRALDSQGAQTSAQLQGTVNPGVPMMVPSQQPPQHIPTPVADPRMAASLAHRAPQMPANTVAPQAPRVPTPMADPRMAGALNAPAPMTPQGMDATTRNMKGQTFHYTPEAQQKYELGDEPNYGVMAQDLAKTPLGRHVVRRGPDGVMMIDQQKATGAQFGMIGRLGERLDALEGKR